MERKSVFRLAYSYKIRLYVKCAYTHLQECYASARVHFFGLPKSASVRVFWQKMNAALCSGDYGEPI